MKKGFTLIELLIVVAIIAILAAIAVPNFLEAQTRAKVARVKTDMRTFATAIEAYTVDNSKPPREQNTTFYTATDQIQNQVGTLVNVAGIMWNGISTPIAYITVARHIDIFQDKNVNPPLDEQYFTYNDVYTRSQFPAVVPTGGSNFWRAAPEFYGAWRMLSVGPDRSFDNTGSSTPSVQLAYDATNGTVSRGNIFRSQKLTDSGQPVPGQTYGNPATVLLGAP
jgi:prepilin-type N-terminal cleavage/methylation domain-containing protein